MKLLTQQIHSLLMINSNGLDLSNLINLLEVNEEEVNSSISELTAYLKDSGTALLQSEQKIQIVAKTDILPAGIQNKLQTEQLSATLLEVLTIIAYHQPITQLEIESMRGIGSEQTIKGLLERDLIESKQKKVDGISLPHYSTTHAFLAHLGITSLDELPQVTKNEGTHEN